MFHHMQLASPPGEEFAILVCLVQSTLLVNGIGNGLKDICDGTSKTGMPRAHGNTLQAVNEMYNSINFIAHHF